MGGDGEAYRELGRGVEGDLSRGVVTTGRSKRWWKREWNGRTKAARKHKKARKERHKETNNRKADVWKQWVAGGRHVWNIGRVARIPAGLKERGRNIRGKEGKLFENDEALLNALVKQDRR